MRSNKVLVVAYDQSWPTAFKNEAKIIQEALGRNCLAIHHIGSTSIPGLAAKPIIDIMPVVEDLELVSQSVSLMASKGYDSRAEAGMLFRHYFQKTQKNIACNVHVYQTGDDEIARYLSFRDWMRTHQSDRVAYGDLKFSLANQYPNDIVAYCLGKDSFVAEIDAKTKFNGARTVHALTDREWAFIKQNRQAFFGKNDHIPNDPQHIHLAYYRGSQVIGYAHIELKSQPVLQMIFVDKLKQSQGEGSQLLAICERWLKQNHWKHLSLEAPRATRLFFEKQGYHIDPSQSDKVDIHKVFLNKVL